jgi:hypothetical protein
MLNFFCPFFQLKANTLDTFQLISPTHGKHADLFLFISQHTWKIFSTPFIDVPNSKKILSTFFCALLGSCENKLSLSVNFSIYILYNMMNQLWLLSLTLG